METQDTGRSRVGLRTEIKDGRADTYVVIGSRKAMLQSELLRSNTCAKA